MEPTVQIVAAALDGNNLNMYKADGDRITIAQGDPRIRALVDKVMPALDRGEKVFLNQEDLTLVNHYGEAETSLGGFAKFYRMAKSKVKQIVDKFAGKAEYDKPFVGHIPAPDDHPTIVQPVEPKPQKESGDVTKSPPLTKSMAAVEEIMANAKPTSDPTFHTPSSTGEETTVVAVLEDGTIIPGMEQIDIQLRAIAGKMGSAVGMINFFKRLATVKHGHSAQDLLKFMEKGELAIADDGCVLVYKRLQRQGDHFVDCHTKKVKQRVGSYVCMDAKLVDPNRSRDCSNGLHIARRDYLSSFSGNVCVLAKLAPEDVIAVPQYDARKIRARAYHIIAELNQRDHDLVTSNRPMEDTVLLGNAIAGNHIGVIEKVEITQQSGGGLIITPVGEGHTTPTLNENLHAQSLDHLPAEVNPQPSSVDAKAFAKDLGKPAPAPVVEPEARLVSAVVPNSKMRPVDMLVLNFQDASTPEAKAAAAQALLDYKKTAKKTWAALGVPAAIHDDAAQRVKKVAEAAVVAPAPVKAATSKKPAKPSTASVKTPAKSKPAAKAPADSQKGKRKDVKLPAVATAVIAAAKPSTVLKGAKPVKRTKKEEAAHLLELYNKNPDLPNARALVGLKKDSKKSWDFLGVDAKLGKKLEERVKP